MVHFQLFTLFVFFLGSAFAKSESQPLQIGHWTAYILKEEGQKICYMVSFPIASKGNYKKRDAPFAMITHRPSEQSYNVVSFQAGYTFASESKVTVEIMDQEIALLTERGAAWGTSEQDELLAKLMTKASKLSVIGKSNRGTITEDVYSLEGSSRALAAITSACKTK